MSLVRLLSAGKSLIGAQDLPRYQLPQTRALPEFSSTKNPFAAAPASTEAAPVPQPATTFPKPLAETPLGTPNTAPVTTRERASVVPAPVLCTDSPAAPQCTAALLPPKPAPVHRSSRLAAFWEKFRGLFRRRKRSTIPNFQHLAVQGELSLDRVKVLRNDLLDTDLEFVTAGSAAKPKAECRAPAKADAAPVPESCQISSTNPSS